MKTVRSSPSRFSMFLVTIGIVYGDIGTSPLYVMKSIVQGNGGISQVTNSSSSVLFPLSFGLSLC